MSTKTYNMGRVVGWSTYEEFLKENPNIDPNKVTPQVYSTLVTYGITRKVLIPSDAIEWEPVQGSDTTFYTATVGVPGATYGATPIVGINYDAYVHTFKNDVHKYSAATAVAGANKELLDKAFQCIFTCYVSDENGVRTEGPSSPSGYLTFAAYPDIIEYLDAVSKLRPNPGLWVLVRGLSLSGYTSNDDPMLYFGPQGMVIGTGGESSEQVTEETVDLSNLCMNATSYIWMSVGGNGAPADFRGLVSHPDGSVMISQFGYLSPDLLNGTGAFEQLGQYAFTYDEYVAGFTGIECVRTQEAAIPATEKRNYYYLIDGRLDYSGHPGRSEGFYIIPVNKQTGFVNIGNSSPMSRPKMKKIIDFSRIYGTDYGRVLYMYDKKLPDYIGSWWGNNCPSVCRLNHTGNNSLTSSRWIDADADLAGGQGRLRSAVYLNQSNVVKGDYYLIYNQSDSDCNGLYMCTRDSEHDGGTGAQLNRRGTYISMNVPQWVMDKGGTFEWLVDLSGISTKSVTDGVLKVNGAELYPNELLVMGTASRYKIFYVLNTVNSAGTQPELIVTTNLNMYLEFTSGVTSVINTHSNMISIPRSTWNSVVSAKTYPNVYISDTQTTGFTMRETGITPGMLIDIKHNSSGVWGYQKDYRYIVLEQSDSEVILASGMVWTDQPNVSAVAGHPATYNSAFPRYNQDLPNTNGSYFYNAPAVLTQMSAKQFFADFGWNIADYVHEDYQELSMIRFLQECVLRNDMSVAMSPSTKRQLGVESTMHLYSKNDVHYTSGQIPNTPMSSSLILSAKTDPKAFFSTAYYSAETRAGKQMIVNNTALPIWASRVKLPDGTETMSVSVISAAGSILDFSGNSGTIEADTVTWLDLLVGLGSGKSVDVLKGARFGRDNNDCNYIQTADGTRLYISTTEPTGDIPEGSIGIGW